LGRTENAPHSLGGGAALASALGFRIDPNNPFMKSLHNTTLTKPGFVNRPPNTEGANSLKLGRI